MPKTEHITIIFT